MPGIGGKKTPAEIADAVGPDAVSKDRFYTPWNKSIFGDPPTLITAWEILDGNYGDCGTLSTLMKYELDLLGARESEGTMARVKFVFAQHDSWEGLVGDGPQFSLMEHEGGYNLDDSKRLGFVSGAFNNYEGCCLFVGKWWMGGTGTFKTKPVDVLYKWADPNDVAQPGEPHQCYFYIQGQVIEYPEGAAPEGEI